MRKKIIVPVNIGFRIDLFPPILSPIPLLPVPLLPVP